MLVFTNQILSLTQKTALVWHHCPLSDYFVKTNLCRCTLIKSQEDFEQTNFKQFNEILVLAELSWEGVLPNKMFGLNIMLNLLAKVDLSKTTVRLISFYSNDFLENSFPNAYWQSILLLNKSDIETDALNVWNITNFNNTNNRKLLRGLYHCVDHNTHIEDLIVRTLTELEQLRLKLENSKETPSAINFGIRLFPKIGQIKHNYIQIIKQEDNLFFKKINQNFQLYSVIGVIEKLQNLKKQKLTLRSIRKITEDLETLERHFQEIKNYLSQKHNYEKSIAPHIRR